MFEIFISNVPLRLKFKANDPIEQFSELQIHGVTEIGKCLYATYLI
jgi:hypothetical protein